MSGSIGSILSNNGAMQALQNIGAAQSSNTTLETQLSSGKKINSPANNPAGFIEAQGFTSQTNGITQAVSNANEGISLLQTAQGAVQQQLGVAQKLNSIAVQAANGTQTAQESQSLQGVVSQLTGQISTIANQTQFNNISLLNGGFSGVQFQVGANEGQTLSLSIGSTAANKIGMYNNGAITSGGSSSGQIYGTSASASAAVSTSSGAFTAGSMTINGSNGSAKVSVTKAESASSIASAVNKLTNQTNVQAQANTNVVLKATAGSGGSYQFKLGNGSGSSATNTVNISATSKSGLVSAINSHTAKTGVTAKLNSSGSLVLQQGQGKNITITGVTQGSFTTNTSNTASAKTYGGTTNSSGSFTSASAGKSLTVQGKVSFQSDKSFSVTNAKDVGLKSLASLHKLSSINVSTTGGANKAINVIKYAIQGLNNLGGQLGAHQQRLQATLNNLQTTNKNLKNGLATVQDANIPQVSQKLTQGQIQAQAGVAALKSSSQLQQAYLKLLP